MVRKETKAAVLDAMMQVGRDAKAQGVSHITAIERAFPGAPIEVITEAWLAVDDEETKAWWEMVEKTIDAEVVKSAVRLVCGDGS